EGRSATHKKILRVGRMLRIAETLVKDEQFCFSAVNSIHGEIKVLTHREGHQVQTVIQVVRPSDLLSTRDRLLTS
ncbi:MAG: hypothetical protein ACK56I_19575, partial [bacterium]